MGSVYALPTLLFIMGYPITTGDLRAKSKTRNANDNADVYYGEIPILLDGVERSVLRVSIQIEDDLTRAQALALISNGFDVKFNGA